MGNILKNRTKIKRMTRYAATTGGICLLVSQNILAAALFDHIVEPYVATQLTYDSNVLRLPKDFTPAMSGGKTNTDSFIKQIKAGVATKWQINQQQLIADVSVNQNWFSTFNELNYTGYNLLGQWNWQLGQKLKGILSYNNSLTLGSFQQTNRLQNNLQKKDNYNAKGTYEIFPDWYLRAQFIRTDTRYSSELRKQANLIENSKDLSFYYSTLLDNMLGFGLIMTDGKYPNRDYPVSSVLDNAYNRVLYYLDGKWNYSVKTRIRGRVGYLSQTFEHQKNRNFSDIVARGDIFWEPTRKSSLLLEAWREIYSADNVIASFQLNEGIRLTPIWIWSETPKVQLELPISYEQQANLVTEPIDVLTSPLQQAKRSIIRLNLNYMPRSNIEVLAFASYEKRNSNNPLRSYQDEMVGLSMKVSF